MPRKNRVHVTGDTPSDQTLAPRHLTKQEFGKRLYKLMLAKGWHQSELARRAGLNRDAISVYIRGRSLPTPASLNALAAALGVAQEELLPNHIESAIDEDNPAFELKASASAPHLAWLRVNRLVTMTTAVKVANLLENDNVADRSGSGGAPAVLPLKDQAAKT